MKQAIDFKNWELYLTRPFDLFSTSLWQWWYESEHMLNALGFKMDEVLCIEISRNLVSQYRKKEQLQELSRNFRKLLYENPKKLETLLKHGLDLADAAKLHLKKRHKWSNLQETIHFFNEVIFYTTVLPNFPSIVLEPDEKLPNTIKALCAQLRLTSFYPLMMQKSVIPMALKHLKQNKVISTRKVLSMLTLKELFSSNVQTIAYERKQIRGKRFVYFKKKGKEVIQWGLNLAKFLETRDSKAKTEVSGLAAYSGKVTGVAHVVLNFMKPKPMGKRQVLISINCNPHLMPLIKKASALVTDEGGITSHAAIVAQELGIPCVIGTKTATKIFKSGDIIEVDANKGTVKKL